MRSDATYPPKEFVGNAGTGINMLPQYGESGGGLMPDDYPLLTAPQNFAPSGNTMPSIPRASPAYPAPGGVQDWRGNSAAYSGRSSYPAPGTQWGGAPLEPKPGFFGSIGNFFQSLVGGAGAVAGGVGNIGQDVIGGLGGLLQGINFQPGQGQGQAPPPMPMRNPSAAYGRPSFGGTSFQSSFPGSMIGPTSGRVTSPYSSAAGPLGGRQPLGGPPSAGAQAFMSAVRGRNIV